MADKLPPVMRQNVIYSDMADNINKVKFRVKVKESYVPHIHYSFLGVNSLPPIREIGPGNMDDVCQASYPLSYIIDALCGGHWLEFDNIEDMEVAKQWLQLYLDECSVVDMTKNPEQQAFVKNVERTLAMLSGNLRRRDEYHMSKHPQTLNITDLLSVL